MQTPSIPTKDNFVKDHISVIYIKQEPLKKKTREYYSYLIKFLQILLIASISFFTLIGCLAILFRSIIFAIRQGNLQSIASRTERLRINIRKYARVT